MCVLGWHRATLPKIIDSCHQFRVVFSLRTLSGSFWEETLTFAGRYAPAFLISLLLIFCAIGSTAAADTGDIIAPSDPKHPSVDSGWQAGTCNAEPPEPGAA